MKFETTAQREFNALWAALFLCGFPGVVIGLTEGWMVYPLLFLPFIFLIIALIAGQRPWLWLLKGAGIFGAAVALGMLAPFFRPLAIREALLMGVASGAIAFGIALLLGLPGTLIVFLFKLLETRVK